MELLSCSGGEEGADSLKGCDGSEDGNDFGVHEERYPRRKKVGRCR